MLKVKIKGEKERKKYPAIIIILYIVMSFGVDEGGIMLIFDCGEFLDCGQNVYF